MEQDEIINAQLDRLRISRRTLQTLLRQQAIHGFANVQPGVVASIEEARDEIARIKQTVRRLDGDVEDYPDDIDPDDAAAQQQRNAVRNAKLRAIFADHTGFINSRLTSFVGRTIELADIRQRIVALLPSGGYVTITGQAGQGKSSIIACILAEYDADYDPAHPQPLARMEPAHIAHHFIPFKPGPDHQVNLLRNLMARLILKHNLSDIYLASESRPALADYFVKVLQEISDARAQEVIFIDGLDQLQEDASTGERDLSFLPNDPPNGIVFVLGTRPNDTLRPLELLKPRREYQLPNLSRADFDLILQHRGVLLTPDLADRFYATMQQNALYLDLVAKELQESGTDQPERIIQKIADNPDNLFTLTIDRLKRQGQQWHTLLKPALGLLLAAREPLSQYALRDLLAADTDIMSEALQRLGGLLVRDDQGRYSLYHLKLQEFLRHDPSRPAGIFAPDEEAGHHQRLAAWCEGGKGGLPAIWATARTDAVEHERRAYARQHYIAHLAAAKNWDQLWHVIEAGDYGRAKLRHDPSTRSYALDLDVARDASIEASAGDLEDSIAALPQLLRYSLWRCQLSSQADNTHLFIFDLLVQLDRLPEAFGLAELLPNPSKKILMLAFIAYRAARDQPHTPVVSQLFARAIEVFRQIEQPFDSVELALAIASLATIAVRPDIALPLLETIERSTSSKPADLVGWVLLLVAVLRSLNDDRVGTFAILDHLPNLSPSDDADEDHLWLLIAKAAVLCLNGDTTQTNALLEQLISVLPKLGKAELKPWLALLCNALTALNGQPQLALQYLDTFNLIEHDADLSQLDAEKITLQLIVLLSRAAIATYCHADDRAANYLDLIAAALIAGDSAKRINVLENIAAPAGILPYLIEYLVDNHDLANLPLIQNHPPFAALIEFLQCYLSAPQLSVALQNSITVLLLDLHSPEHTGTTQEEYAHIANMLAFLNHTEDALKLTERIDDAEPWINATTSMARWLMRRGSAEQASQLLQQPPPNLLSAEQLALQATTLAWSFLHEKSLALSQEQLDQAIYAVRRIESTSQRDSMFTLLATALTQIQQFEQALSIARTITAADRQTEALQSLATALAQAQQFEQALSIARSITAADKQTEALQSLTITLAQAQQFEQALTAAHSITDPSWQAQTLQSLAIALGQAQQFEQALTAAHSITDPSWQAQTLQSLAIALGQAQQFEQAFSIARSITEPSWQAEALQSLAVALTQAQQFEQALSIARSITAADRRAEALQSLAAAWLPSASAQAQQVFEQALTAAHSITAADRQSRALQSLAAALTQAQQFEQALSIAHSITDPSWQAQALQSLATELAQAQRFEQALTAAHSITDPSWQTEALQSLAAALTQAQRFEQALTAAHSITDPSWQAEALKSLAIALVQAQRFEQALTAAHSITDPFWQAEALKSLAIALVQAQQFEQALSIARGITEPSWQAEALQSLATAWLPSAPAQAQQVFEQALTAAHRIKATGGQAQALQSLATTLASTNQQPHLVSLIHQSWRAAETTKYLFDVVPIAYSLLAQRPTLSQQLVYVLTHAHRPHMDTSPPEHTEGTQSP